MVVAQIVLPTKRKRRRTWESVRRIGTVLLSSSALPSAQGQSSFYATCRGQVQSVDVDGDEALSEAEFKSFLFQFSGGSASLGDGELPAGLSEPFSKRQNDETQLMDISPSSGGALDFFCKEMYSGLLQLFNISVLNNDCITALQAGDTQPMNGQLLSIEYVAFLNALTGSQDYSDPYESLSTSLQNAFNDLATGGIIDGAKGTEYLIEFCERSLLAAIVPQVPPTPAPTGVIKATTNPTGATAIPTVAGSNTDSTYGTAAPTSSGSAATIAPTQLGSGNTPLPTIDTGSTMIPSTVLGRATLVPTHTATMGGSVTELPTTITGTFLPTTLGSDKTSSPSTSGSTDRTPSPTAEGTSVGSADGSGSTFSPTMLPTYSEKTQAPTFASLSASQFNTCKTALVVSDINRNDRLEQQEFVRFISRMATNQKLASNTAFKSMDGSYIELYDNLSTQEAGGLPRLEGTKPGTTPSRNQRASILNMCQETYLAIRRYDQDGPSSPSGGNDDDSTDGYGDFDKFFQNCKTAMVVSDLNRDDVLEELEFVRFATRLKPDIFNRVATFQQLDPAFRASYSEVSSMRGVVIFGSKPGQRSTGAQLDHVENVCQSAKRAIDTIVANGGTNVSLPPPTLSPTINPGSLSTDFFRRCKTAMLIADLNRDDSLSQEEYVRLLNRLTLSQFAGKGFDELDALFQLEFYKVAIDGRVDVSGSKPGQPTDRKIIEHLTFVCEKVKESIDVFAATGGTGVGPIFPVQTQAPVAVTFQPSTAPITSSELGNCLESIMKADTNRNFLLEEKEFVQFLASASSQNVEASFKDLPSQYVFSFREAASQGDVVDLASIDDSHLSRLCEDILAQGNLATIPSPQSCSASLLTSDADGNKRLTEDEYSNFVHALRKSRKSSFDILPFVLRENFSWLKLNRSYVDINGVATFESLESGDDIRLQWICERTGQALSALEEDDSIAQDDHCLSTMLRSDNDFNGYIDQEEFVGLMRRFSGAKLNGLDFQSAGKLRSVFNTAKSDDNNMIDIETASVNGVCFELKKAADEERESEAFFELCSSSLRFADSNSDESLSKEEYILFLFTLAIAYGQAEEMPTDIQYENLNKVLRLNFDVLAGQDDSVLIPGVQSQPNKDQFADLRWVCQNTESIVDLISSRQETVVTVYNAFYVSNTKGVVASDLKDGPDRDLLEAAYLEFVEDQVSVLLKLHKTRKLTVGELIPSSAFIYQIDDVQCFADFPSKTYCQVVYGSFDLSVIDEDDEDLAAAKYTETTQSTIDRGALQLKLILLDDNAAFTVEQAVNPAKPSSNQVFVPSRRPNAAVEPVAQEGEASLFMTLLSGALVSSAIFGTLYYWFFYIRKGKVLCGEDKHIESVDDDVKASGMQLGQADSSRTGEDEETGFSGQRGGKEVATKIGSTFDADNISVESSTGNSFADFVSSVSKVDSTHSSDQGSSGSGRSKDHSKQEIESMSNTTSENSKSSDSQSSESSDLHERVTQLKQATSSTPKSSHDLNDSQHESSDSSEEAFSDPESDQSISVDEDVDSTKSSLPSDSHVSSSNFDDKPDDVGNDEDQKRTSPDAAALSSSAGSESEPSHSEAEETSVEVDNDEGKDSFAEQNDQEEEDGVESMSYDEADTLVHSTMSLNTTDLNAGYEKYRPIVEDLVRQVVPDEINNVDTMMEQFIGRERELVRTLRNMAGIEDSEEADSDDFDPSDYSDPSEYSEDDNDFSEDEELDSDNESIEEESIESDEEL